MRQLDRPLIEMKRLAKGALRSIGPSPELIADLHSLRSQVETNSGRVDKLVEEVASLAEAVTALEAARDEDKQTFAPLTNLAGTVVGLSERVHAHEQELRQIQVKLEQFAGSVLDELAVDRRLRVIEDRILESSEEFRQ